LLACGLRTRRLSRARGFCISFVGPGERFERHCNPVIFGESLPRLLGHFIFLSCEARVRPRCGGLTETEISVRKGFRHSSHRGLCGARLVSGIGEQYYSSLLGRFWPATGIYMCVCVAKSLVLERPGVAPGKIFTRQTSDSPIFLILFLDYGTGGDWTTCYCTHTGRVCTAQRPSSNMR